MREMAMCREQTQKEKMAAASGDLLEPRVEKQRIRKQNDE